MKVEVELDENLIKEELQKQVASSIRAICSSWATYENCKLKVNEVWDESITSIIKEELANSAELRVKIVSAIERKIQNQLINLMKTKQP